MPVSFSFTCPDRELLSTSLIEEESSTKYTILMAAIARKCYRATRVLLSIDNIDCERINSIGMNAMYVACSKANDYAIKRLLELGSDIEKRLVIDGIATSPLDAFFRTKCRTFDAIQNCVGIIKNIISVRTINDYVNAPSTTPIVIGHIQGARIQGVNIPLRRLNYINPNAFPRTPEVRIIQFDEPIIPIRETIVKKIPKITPKYVEYNDNLPRDFDCPICMCALQDPVITSIGNAYCRECITESWNSGNHNDPLTNLQMSDVFYDAIIIKKLMSNYIK